MVTHMTFTTKVGVPFVVDMNDDMPQVDNFSCGCYQALFPCILRREPGTEARLSLVSRVIKLGGLFYNSKQDLMTSL